MAIRLFQVSLVRSALSTSRAIPVEMRAIMNRTAPVTKRRKMLNWVLAASIGVPGPDCSINNRTRRLSSGFWADAVAAV